MKKYLLALAVVSSSLLGWAQRPGETTTIRPRNNAPATCSTTQGSFYWNTSTQRFYGCTATNTVSGIAWQGDSLLSPIPSGLLAAIPTTCLASKQLYIATDAAVGQQLRICNSSGNGFVAAASAAQVNVDWNALSGVAQILNKPTLATVATSGSYADLTAKPTIPAAQVNSDWNAVSGLAQVLNKPTIPAAQVNVDWNSLSGITQILNKPTLGTAAAQNTTAFDAAGAATTAQAAAIAASAQKANNLSDLANATTARTNLGLGTAATTASSAYDVAGAAAAVTAGTVTAASKIKLTYPVGVGGVTANKLVKFDTLGNVIASLATDTSALGVAETTVAATGSVVVDLAGGVFTCIADNTTIINDLITTGSTTAGACKDTGAASSSTLSNSTGKLGRFLSAVTAGSVANVFLYGPGHQGTLIDSVNGAAIPISAGSVATNASGQLIAGTTALSSPQATSTVLAGTAPVILPATYWRLNVLADGNNSGPTIAELGLHTTVGGANVATGGTATASSCYSSCGGVYGPASAFNGNGSTDFWNGNTAPATTPDWIQYQFASPVAIVEFSIQDRTGFSTTQAPTSVTLQSSNDGVTFLTQATFTITWAGDATQTFLVGPANNPATTPTFRNLLAGDIPSLPYAAAISGQAYASQYRSPPGIGFNGIGPAVLSGNPYVIVEPTYPPNEGYNDATLPYPAGAFHLTDFRGGRKADVYHNWANSSNWGDSYGPAQLVRCRQDGPSLGLTVCAPFQFTSTQPGWSIGNPGVGTQNGWEVHNAVAVNLNVNSEGIDENLTIGGNKYGNGDWVGFYSTITGDGGWTAASDEGTKSIAAATYEDPHTYTGTFAGNWSGLSGLGSFTAAGGTGLTSIKTTQGTNPGGEGVGHFFIDTTQAPINTQVSANANGSNYSTVTVVATVPISNAWGTLSGAAPPGTTPNLVAPFTNQIAFNVTGTTGTFDTTHLACFNSTAHECFIPNAVGSTISGTTCTGTPVAGSTQCVAGLIRRTHAGGYLLMQGGMAGYGLENTGETVSPQGQPLRFLSEVIGSTGANTILVQSWKTNTVQQAMNTYNPANINLSNLSCTGTACTATYTGGTQYHPFNSWFNVSLVITGASDSALNTTLTGLLWGADKASVTFTIAGLTGTHTALTATATQALETINLYPMAEVLDVQDYATNPVSVDGTLLLEPNIVTTAVGDAVEITHHLSALFAAGVIGVTTYNSHSTGVGLSIGATGLGNGLAALSMSTAPAPYAGLPNMINMNGPYQYGLNFSQMGGLPSGAMIQANCSAAQKLDVNFDAPVINVLGNGAGASYWTVNCNNGNNVMQSQASLALNNSGLTESSTFSSGAITAPSFTATNGIATGPVGRFGSLELESIGPNTTLYTSNCNYNGTNWTYISNGWCNFIQVFNGDMSFNLGPNGIAGNTLTASTGMTLKANGTLQVGNAAQLTIDATGNLITTGTHAQVLAAANPGLGLSILAPNLSGTSSQVYVQVGKAASAGNAATMQWLNTATPYALFSTYGATAPISVTGSQIWLNGGNVYVGNSSATGALAPSGGGLFNVGTTNQFQVASTGAITQGTTASTATATPMDNSLGGTFGSNTPGNNGNCKLDLFNDGTAIDKYCWGMSSGLMEFQVPTAAVINWYVAATKVMGLTGTGLAVPGTLSVGSTSQFQVSNAGVVTAPTVNATSLQVGGTAVQIPLSVNSASIGGGALAAGACTSTITSTPGATTSMVASASPVTYPGDGFYWVAYVSATSNVAVKLCAVVAGTPTASAYNIRVIQ